MNPKLMAAYLETARDSGKKKPPEGSAISSQIRLAAKTAVGAIASTHRAPLVVVLSTDQE